MIPYIPAWYSHCSDPQLTAQSLQRNSAGFLSPASRGALLTALLVMYLLLAVAAGFSSVWLWGIIHRSYEGWYAVAWRVACYFPGISLLLLSVLNVLIHHTGSSGAIPLGAFFSLVSLWFLISIPLCFSGQFYKGSQTCTVNSESIGPQPICNCCDPRLLCYAEASCKSCWMYSTAAQQASCRECCACKYIP